MNKDIVVSPFSPRQMIFCRAALPILTLALLLCQPLENATAQEAGLDTLLIRANTLFQADRWKEAAEIYQQLIAKDSANHPVSFLLAQCYFQLGDYSRARSLWERVESGRFRLPTTRYNLATTSMKLGDIESAFSWLAQALEVGFDRVDVLRGDPDLEVLRQDDRFTNVLQLAERNARPCEFEPIYRILDFWVGEWDVFINETQRIGYSLVRRKANGCAILEDYQQLDGFVGQNLFYYDYLLDTWRMIWITGSSMILGGIKDNNLVARTPEGGLVFQGELPFPEGLGKILDRTTIAPVDSNRVRMLIQQSRDGGTSWSTIYNGTYVRSQR